MGIAREATPEIDLVLFVWNLGSERSGQLAELARERGLETLELLDTADPRFSRGGLLPWCRSSAPKRAYGGPLVPIRQLRH